MKQYFLFTLIILTVNAFGQATSDNNKENKIFAVKANILPLLIDNNTEVSYFLFSTAFRIDLEKSLSKNKSLVFEIGFAGPLTFDIEHGEAGENIATTGITTGFGNKFYFGNPAAGS